MTYVLVAGAAHDPWTWHLVVAGWSGGPGRIDNVGGTWHVVRPA